MRRAWNHDSPAMARDYALAARHRAGRIDDATFKSTRDAWIAEDKQLHLGMHYWHWLVHYGMPARTRAEAMEALDVLPQFMAAPTDPVLATPSASVFAGLHFNAVYGRVRYLAGDAAGALPWLRGATNG